MFGTAIGAAGISVAANQGHLEMYMDGASRGDVFPDDYWYAVTYDPTSGTYEQSFVSDRMPSGIQRLRVGNVTGDTALEIVAFLADGSVRIYDQGTKVLERTFPTPAREAYFAGMALADLDGDGLSEIILTTDTVKNLWVYGGDGVLRWTLPGIGGNAVAAAQMDADPAIEIAVTGGQVVDSGSRSVEWTRPAFFEHLLESADIDGDGMEELIVVNDLSLLAYDVDAKVAKWTIPMVGPVDAIHVADFDHDGVIEVLVGDYGQGSVRAFDTVTRSQEWSVRNLDEGITNIATADVDGDGENEVIFGAGAITSGPDRLIVVGRTSGAVEWENVHLDGPFVGPAVGDLDGDGVEEIVAASVESEATYSNGRIVVLDGVTHRLRAISEPVADGHSSLGTQDVLMADFDGDGDQEILIASDSSFGGVVEIWDLEAGASLERIWTNTTQAPYVAFFSVGVADVDGDGTLEIIAGGDDARVYVYDLATGAELAHSTVLGYGSVRALEVDDFDGDGARELAAQLWNGPVHVLDLGTLADEATIDGSFSSMRKASGATSIQLGGLDGAIRTYAWNGADYAPVRTAQLANQEVYGFERLENDLYSVGSGDFLRLSRGATAVWESPSYGPFTGRRTVRTQSGELVTVSRYAILGFAE